MNPLARRSFQTAVAILLTVPFLLFGAALAYAGSGAKSTCTESFAKWHIDIEQPPGGTVEIDFGPDGNPDYATTLWESHSFTGLGRLIPGDWFTVTWRDGDGNALKVKGRGVPVAHPAAGCNPDTTVPTTEPSTTVPSTTQPPPVTTMPATPTVPPDAPTSTPPPSTPNVPATTSQPTQPSTTVPADVSACSVQCVTLPGTGAALSALLAGIATVAVLVGWRLLVISQIRKAPPHGL